MNELSKKYANSRTEGLMLLMFGRAIHMRIGFAHCLHTQSIILALLQGIVSFMDGDINSSQVL